MRGYSRYLPILSESYEQALHNAGQDPVRRVDEIVFDVLWTREEVVNVPSTCNETRTYSERNVTHGEERTERDEELRKGGPFPMAAELVNVGVVRGLWLLGEGGRRGNERAGRDAARHTRSQASRYKKVGDLPAGLDQAGLAGPNIGAVAIRQDNATNQYSL